MAGIDRYRAALRAPIRGVLTGVLDFDQAFDSIMISVNRSLRDSWHEGLKEAGLQPADMTPAERIALQQAIASETNHITGLIEFVEGLAVQVDAGELGKRDALNRAYARVDLWANRYPDVKSHALRMAQSDPKLEWKINYTREVEENCPTCLRLNGKVKRASFWARSGVYPQNPPNPELECRGWQCGCATVPTDKPLSRGPLPKTP